MQIIDAHVHLHVRSGLKVFVEACENAGIEKSFVCALPQPGMDNTAVEKALLEYPDLVKGFAYIDLDRDKPVAIDEAYSRGFIGIKLIAPRKPYDWEGYFPLYETADQHDMPALFHTGIVARGTRTSEEGVTSANMRPVFLETIARRFPNLTVIGAHLGHPWCDEAAVVSFHNPNVYFDISGGHTFFIAQALQRRFGYDLKPTKLLFGTDSAPESFQKFADYWEVLLPQLGCREEDLRLIFHENARRILSRPGT